MKKTILFFLGIAALSGSSFAQSVLIDFNTAATDFTGNFTASTGTSTAFTWGSAVGVSDQAGPAQGGGVSVSTDTGGANYNFNTAYDLGTGSPTNTWTISTFFRTNATTGTSANQVAGLGLMSSVTDEIAANGRFVGVTLRQGTASTADLTLALTNNVSGTQSNTPLGGVFTPLTNNWYKLTLDVIKTSTADQFSVSASVEDWGSLGTSFESTVRSFSGQTLTNATIYGDSSLFAGFYARQTAGNPIQIQAVDNFSVVPEPTTWVLLAGSLTALLVFRRRCGV